MVTISADVDGRALDVLSGLIVARSRWLDDSARDSVRATAVTFLQSLRALTRTARKTGEKVEVVASSLLVPSFRRWGGKVRPCIRVGKNGNTYTPAKGTRVVYADGLTNISNQRVYTSEIVRGEGDRRRTYRYVVVASSKANATRAVRAANARRIASWRGLARAAVSALMRRAGGSSTTSGKIGAKANANARVTERGAGNTFSVSILDNLDYAECAVKGGASGISLALERACNKSASNLNRRCADIIGWQPLATPFPEVKQRKS